MTVFVTEQRVNGPRKRIREDQQASHHYLQGYADLTKCFNHGFASRSGSVRVGDGGKEDLVNVIYSLRRIPAYKHQLARRILPACHHNNIKDTSERSKMTSKPLYGIEDGSTIYLNEPHYLYKLTRTNLASRK